MNIWLIIWYRGGEGPCMHIHTNFQPNLTYIVSFTAHLMRWGQVSKISQLDTLITHIHTTLSLLTPDPTLIKCAVKLTLLVQFR